MKRIFYFKSANLKVMYFSHQYIKSCSGSYFICEWSVHSYVNITSTSFNYTAIEIKSFYISGICVINVSPCFSFVFQMDSETVY